MTANSGITLSWASEYFMPSLWTTAKWVASLPVPAVVGMAINGQPDFPILSRPVVTATGS